MDCPRFQHWARVCLNVFVEGEPHRFDRDQSKAKPGGGEKEGANPASLRGILAVVGGGCIQRAEELGQPSPSCENRFLKVHMIGGSHDQVGRQGMFVASGGETLAQKNFDEVIAVMRLAVAAVIFLQ